MIVSIGSDLVYMPRIRDVYTRRGESFLMRCFHANEIDYILAAENETERIARMARRWAAKEALGKALGMGIRGDIRLKDITVVKDANGCPAFKLWGGAEKALAAKNAVAHLSLADDGDYAQAFVVLSLKKA